MAQKIITTENLNEVTAQEVFDYVTKKVIEQGEPSIDLERDSCIYKNGNLRCAAGHLIPDNINTKSWDSNGLTWCQLVEKELVPSNHLELISELQRAHDNVAWQRVNDNKIAFLRNIKVRFAKIAKQFNLECDYEN